MTKPSHPESGDADLEMLFRESRREIPDDGFSERVTAALPPRPVIREACSKRATILLVAFVASCLLFRWIGVPADLPLRPKASEVFLTQRSQGHSSELRWDFRSPESGKLLMEELAAVGIALAGLGAVLYSLIEER